MFFLRRHQTGVAIAAFTLLIAGVLFLRRPDILLRSQFWAEDGSVFFADQVSYGFWRSIAIEYAGYLHFIPRLIAGGTQFVPVRWMPLAFNTCALATVAVCLSAFCWPCFRALVSCDALRAGSCLVMAAAIPAGDELIVSVCNLQTFLSVLALLLVYRNYDGNNTADRRKGIEVALAVGLVLICLTAPGTMLLTPFLVWQLIRNRGWRRLTPLLAVCALVIQVSVIETWQAGKLTLNFNALFLATISGGVSRSVLAPLIGHGYLVQDTTRALFVKLLLAFALCVALIVAQLVSPGTRERRWLLLGATYAGTAWLALALAGRNLADPFLTIGGIRATQGERYFLLPSCVFIFILAMAVERWLRPMSEWAKGAILPVTFCLGILQNFKVAPLADFAWPANAVKIAAWQQAVGRHEAVGPLVIAINPAPNTMTLLPRR